MVSDYVKVGLMEDARQVFDEMLERNVIPWISMVARYANLGDVGAARELFNEMLEKNAVSWMAMIAGYGMWGDVEGAPWVFGVPARDADLADSVAEHMEERCVELTLVTTNALAKCFSYLSLPKIFLDVVSNAKPFKNFDAMRIGLIKSIMYVFFFYYF
ncbi:pentatricopeptide repeat-containing protein At1g14470-like [Magnolia sinica]|uniref:pentatricopeptide repeat-containing protein At1g14470-like n=1 Tax=Magnolia sinica TaxID=86752 RepID=UPI00265861E7|nr:pentatricopeptide repeat-containing protein At1g14470-like [Magnolia sinica]